MPNKILANDWLESGKKHLEIAEILFKNGHYNDIVGLELQQSIERVLKAIPAYHNRVIIRSHDLSMILEDIKNEIQFENDIKELCEIATDYFQDNRYPGGDNNFLPSDQEIEQVIAASEFIYSAVNEYINK
jgi:HEPN domain-containing protein